MSKNTVFVKLNKRAHLYNLWRNGKTKLISLKGHQDLNVAQKDYQNPFKDKTRGPPKPFQEISSFKRRLRSALSNSYYLIWDFAFTRLLRRPDAFNFARFKF